MAPTKDGGASKAQTTRPPMADSDAAKQAPLVICFHGSGDSCDSWVTFAQMLNSEFRLLLYNRGPGNLKPKQAVTNMLKHLTDESLPGPYVLVAHSYGGCIAREFLQRRKHDVVGMVLAETGQETAINPSLEKKQYRRQVLGRKPLSVIRANSLIGKWQQYEIALANAENEQQRLELLGQKQLLETWDKEDERLKAKQLKLSSYSHYIHVPDCGHHVIRDRPGVVADQVRWVMQTWKAVDEKETFWRKLTNAMASRAADGKGRLSEMLIR